MSLYKYSFPNKPTSKSFLSWYELTYQLESDAEALMMLTIVMTDPEVDKQQSCSIYRDDVLIATIHIAEFDFDGLGLV